MAGHPIPFRVQLTPNWAITLNEQFLQRDEDKSLVLFNDEISIWIRAYSTQNSPNIIGRMERDVGAASQEAVDLNQEIAGGVGRVSYLVPSQVEVGKSSPAIFYTFSHATDTQLIMSFVHQNSGALARSKAIYASLEYAEPIRSAQ